MESSLKVRQWATAEVECYVTQNSTTRPRADDHLPSARRLRRCVSRPCLVLPSGSAYSMSNETYLPPTFAIAWTPIRISGTSRMMAMGNRKTTARVRLSITPRRCTSIRAFKLLSFRKLNSITWDTILFHKEEREMD